MKRGFAAFLLTLISVTSLASRQQTPSPASKPPLTSGATAIVVDAIVVDSKGNPVTDLRKDDFQLLEDHVQQDIGDVTFMGDPRRSDSAAGTPAGTPPASSSRSTSDSRPVGPSHGPRFLALVFDRLSNEARALAYNAALACVDELEPDEYAAVYVANLSLETIQDYTNDREKLRVAAKEAASRATASFNASSVGGLGQGDPRPETPIVASAESVGRPVDTRATAGETAVIAIQTRNTWEALERLQQGYATTDALLAIATGLGRAPGRKSIVFLAEGVAIPDPVLPRFRDVIATANRANVSVYTIDAAGLRVHSKDAEMGRAVRQMGAAGLALGPDGSSQSSLAMMEYNEDYLRRDPRTSLTLLAGQTGGFLVENTNDLAAGIQRIQADRRSYYLLTYMPKNSNFDGTWRSIAVKVPNRRVTVRARAGYVAVRTAATAPLLAYEGPALAALERTPLPAELSVHGGAFVFPQRTAPNARLAVLVATDGAALAQHVDKTKAGSQTDFTVLARLKDASGEIVRKASQRYRLPADLRGDVLFFRQPTLPPGAYTFEYVVHDARGQRAGAGTAPVLVPAARAGDLQVSSLMIVRRTERVAASERDASNPLYYGDLLLYPSLGEPISKRETPALTFAFNVIPGSAPVTATLTLAQGERTIGQTALQLGAPDAQGRIWNVGQLPIANLAPGEYTLAVSVTASADVQTRRTSVRIAE